MAVRQVLRFPHPALKVTARSLPAEERAGTDRVAESDGFEARCLLHEIDHLDGLLLLTESIPSRATCSAASATAERYGWRAPAPG